MNRIARFVTRPSEPSKEDSPPDIFIGAFFTSQDKLKSHTVYEIAEVMGELILKEVGESCISKKYWNTEIHHIMMEYGNRMILTKDEVYEIDRV